MTAGPVTADAAAPAAADRLPRRLGVWSAAAVAVGTTIGSGIFRVPSSVAEAAGTVGAVGALWVLGAVVALAGALTLAELAVLYPRSGGIYVFLREAYGPTIAFLFGWTQLLVIRPSALGALAMIFAAYLSVFIPMTDGQVRVAAALTIALVTAANYRSLVFAAAVENATTAGKVLALLVLAGVAFALGGGSGALAAPIELAPASWGGFGIALIAVLWAYDGWADLTFIAGEVRDPARTLPRALIAGTLIVAAVYMVVNAAYLWVLPLDRMAASELVAADAAIQVVGRAGGAVIAALVLLSVFGSLNGSMMTGPRIFWAMADDDLFFRPVAGVHPRFGTPHVAVALAGALGIAYVSIRTFEQLAGAFILGIWPFYALAVGAVFIVRRRHPDLPRPYRALGYPVVPLLFLLASVAMLLNALAEQPLSTAVGFAIILAGGPVYFVWKGRR